MKETTHISTTGRRLLWQQMFTSLIIRIQLVTASLATTIMGDSSAMEGLEGPAAAAPFHDQFAIQLPLTEQ